MPTTNSKHPIDYFDRIEALYWFSADFHGGQWSFLYKVNCIITSKPNRRFKPSPLAHGPHTDDAIDYYDNLQRRHETHHIWEN